MNLDDLADSNVVVKLGPARDTPDIDVTPACRLLCRWFMALGSAAGTYGTTGLSSVPVALRVCAVSCVRAGASMSARGALRKAPAEGA